MPVHQRGAAKGVYSFGPACFATLGLLILARSAVLLLPCESWGPSGYLCAVRFLHIPFGESHTCIAEQAFGEGARLANRLDYVSLRSEKFTTDERGCRNLPTPGLERARVLLTGSSFSLGMSLSDEETLSAQINQRLGPLVYNASSTMESSLSSVRINRLSASLGLRRGWVLLEVLNRAAYSYEASSRARVGFQGFNRQQLAGLFPRWYALARAVYNPFGLVRLSSMLNMRLHDDRLLPNPYRNEYVEEELISGRRMLFFSADREFSRHFASPAPTATAVALLRDDLQSSELELLTILVPTAYAVYYPLIQRTDVADFGNQYMAELAVLLAQKGIPTFNCLPILREAAAKELAAGRLVYWPDDAHWNPAGVAACASGIAPWLGALTRRASSPEH